MSGANRLSWFVDRYYDGGLVGLMDKRLTQASHRRAPVDEVMALLDRYRLRHRGWKIPSDQYRCNYVKANVRVHRYPDRTLAIFHGPRKLASYNPNGTIKKQGKEEVRQEAFTRNIPAFSRFLELAAFENGNILNFNSISRDSGVRSRTVKEYFQLLEDTLLGFMLFPFKKSHRARLVSHPRFHFFDNGIATSLLGELSRKLSEGTPPYGDAFERWVIIETRRLQDYRRREFKNVLLSNNGRHRG